MKIFLLLLLTLLVVVLITVLPPRTPGKINSLVEFESYAARLVAKKVRRGCPSP